MRRWLSARAITRLAPVWLASDSTQHRKMVQQVVSWLPKSWGLVSEAQPIPEDAAVAWVVRVDRMLGKLAVCALLLAMFQYSLSVAHSRTAIADFHPLNGDFQNFNPVRRLFLGEQPGHNFDSYLGLGPVYLL